MTVLAGGDIQAAITAATAGNTICLEPGLYPPTATVVIDKPLSIKGEQCGIDPRPGVSAGRPPGSPAESIIDGGGALSTILRIDADDVTLDGIEVRNGTGDLIATLGGTVLANPALRNLIVHASVNPGDEAIQLRNTTDAVIEYNHVFDTNGDGINVCCGSTGMDILYNEVHDIDTPDAAIYVYAEDGIPLPCPPGTDVDALIQGNLVYDVPGNDGIKLGSKSGNDACDTGGVIRNNIVGHEHYLTRQDGIAVYMSGTLVEENEVFRSVTDNGGIFIQFAVSDVTVQKNSVHDNGPNPSATVVSYGIKSGSAPDTATVHVNDNCIEKNQGGVRHSPPTPTSDLDATYNWWGHSSGANPPGSGDTWSGPVLIGSPQISAAAAGCVPYSLLSLPAMPDLAVRTMSGVPATMPSSLSFSVTERTRNFGNASSVASTTRFYLSMNTFVDSGDVELGTRAVPALGTTSLTYESLATTALTVSPSTAPGTYYVIAEADSDLDNAEKIENNNIRSMKTLIAPDLRVLSLTRSASVVARGGTLDVADQTENRSGASIAAPASVTTFYLSADGTLGSGDVELDSRGVPVLALGASDIDTTTLTIPFATAPGTWRIIAKADGPNAIPETTETNNTRASATFQVGPDLRPTALSHTPAGNRKVGVPFNITDTTRNEGGEAAGSSKTRFYLSGDAVLDLSDTPIATRTIASIAPVTSNSGSTSVTISTAGSYYIIAVADDDDEVIEADETDNLKTHPITVDP